jgi:hypothetical protein
LRGIMRSQPDLDALRDYARQMGLREGKGSQAPAADSWAAGASSEVKELAHGTSAEGQGWGGSGNEVIELNSEQAKDPSAAEWEQKVKQRADEIRREASRRGGGGSGGYIGEPRGGVQPDDFERGDSSGVTDFVSDLIQRRGQSAGASSGTARPKCTGDAARDTVLSQIGGGCEGQAGTWSGRTGDPTDSASGGAFRPRGGNSGTVGGQVPGFSNRGAIPEAPSIPAGRSGVSRPRSSGGPGVGEFPTDPGYRRGIRR